MSTDPPQSHSLAGPTAEMAAAFESVAAGVFVHDAEGRLVYANSAACRILGLSEADLLAAPPDSPLWRMEGDDGQELEQFQRPWDAARRAGAPVPDVAVAVYRDDPARRKWLLVSSRPIDTPPGAVVSTFQDITSRRQADDAVRAILRSTGALTGDEFFQSLAVQLSLCLRSRYVIVGRLDDTGERVRTVAICDSGVIGPNVTYRLRGTPCETVIGKTLCSYPSGVQRLFPDDEILAVMGAESYMGVPLFSSAGEPLGVMAAIHTGLLPDTESARSIMTLFAARAAAEMERQRVQEDLDLARFSVDRASDSAFWLDEQGRILYVNDAACRSLGYTRQELLSLSVFDVDPTAKPDRWRARWSEMEKVGAIHVETRQRRKDGSYLPVEVALNFLQRRGRKYCFAFARDISARLEAQTVREESERRLQDIIDAAPFGAHTYILTQSGDLIFTGCNRSADRILGIQHSGLLGLTIEEAFPGIASTDIPEMYRRTAATGQPFEREEVHYSHGKIDGVFEVFAFQPSYHRVAVFFRDVTARFRVAEAKRRLHREMQRHQRRFYRETILSVTAGRFDLCELDRIRPYLATSEMCVDVPDAQAAVEVRHRVQALMRGHGLASDALESMALAAGEALANALKHGRKATVYAGLREGRVWFAVADKGRGIESLVLPKAVLGKGYSTKPSLGLGFTIMLQSADRILLHTGRRGTTILLERSLTPSATPQTLDFLADVWDTVL